jgi:WD40 repeat protein
MFTVGPNFFTAGGGAPPVAPGALIVGGAGSPPLRIYDPTAGFSLLSNPASPPPATLQTTAISVAPDKSLLGFGSDTSPFMRVYVASTLAAVSNPVTLPTDTGRCISFSPDGQFCAVGSDGAPFINIYQVSAGPTLTKLTNPSSLPSGPAVSCVWSPDGNYLALGLDVSPWVFVYSRSGTTFTKLGNPGTTPGGAVRGICFSPDGSLLVCSGNKSGGGSRFINVYAWPTFVLGAQPIVDATGFGFGCNFNFAGTIFAASLDASPFVERWSVSSGVFTKLSNPAVLPGGAGRDVKFSRDDVYMAVAHGGTPFVTIYTVATWVKVANPSTLPAGNCNGVAWN